MGIEWSVRFDVWDERAKLQYDVVEVKINPKTLCGIYDYITAATIKDLNGAIEIFDNISKSISPLLGTFRNYGLKRIDYCVNFSVNELAPGCTSEQIMNLIKRSNVPPGFKEYMEYDKKSHRKKPMDDSFYLMNKSVSINCYRKAAELQQRVEKTNKGNPLYGRYSLSSKIFSAPLITSPAANSAERISRTVSRTFFIGTASLSVYS